MIERCLLASNPAWGEVPYLDLLCLIGICLHKPPFFRTPHKQVLKFLHLEFGHKWFINLIISIITIIDIHFELNI